MSEHLTIDAPARPEDEDGGSVLPALAEAHRRGGRADEAEQVARRALEFEPERMEARVVLALALIDQGRMDEAHRELEGIGAALLAAHGVDPPQPVPYTGEDEELSEAELEAAFADAQPEREHMFDTDDIAEQAMREADRELSRELVARANAPFATRTVAELLESQGAAAAASEVRAVLDGTAGTGNGRVLAELERWLQNLRENRR